MKGNLEIKNLTFRQNQIGEKFSLKNITLTIPKGKLIGLIGQNGSGKSTLLKTIIGFHFPHAGQVYFENKNIHKLSRKEISNLISFIPQERTDSVNLLVEDIIKQGFYAKSKIDDKLLREVLHLTQTELLKKRFFYTLSEGEKQRVLLARALVQDTPFLLLDEPTAYLDLKFQIETLRLLKILSQQKGILLAIHDIELACQYCDLLAVLSDGVLVAFEKPSKDLLTRVLKDFFQLHAAVQESEMGIKIWPIESLSENELACLHENNFTK